MSRDSVVRYVGPVRARPKLEFRRRPPSGGLCDSYLFGAGRDELGPRHDHGATW